MTQSTPAGRGGLGFFSLLGLMFIGLRLCGVIDWPWIWVLAPLWVPLSLAMLFVFASVAVMGILLLVSVLRGPKR